MKRLMRVHFCQEHSDCTFMVLPATVGDRRDVFIVCMNLLCAGNLTERFRLAAAGSRSATLSVLIGHCFVWKTPVIPALLICIDFIVSTNLTFLVHRFGCYVRFSFPILFCFILILYVYIYGALNLVSLTFNYWLKAVLVNFVFHFVSKLRDRRCESLWQYIAMTFISKYGIWFWYSIKILIDSLLFFDNILILSYFNVYVF